jgi:hypothetical protein
MSITLAINNLLENEVPLCAYDLNNLSTYRECAAIDVEEDGTVFVRGTGPEHSGISRAVANRATVRVDATSCVNVRGAKLAEFIRLPKTVALLERIHTGHDVEDGFGSLSDDAESAVGELEQALNDLAEREAESVTVLFAIEHADEGSDWPEELTLEEAVERVEKLARESRVIIADGAEGIEEVMLLDAEKWLAEGRASATQIQALLDAGKIDEAEAEEALAELAE